MIRASLCYPFKRICLCNNYVDEGAGLPLYLIKAIIRVVDRLIRSPFSHCKIYGANLPSLKNTANSEKKD